MTEIERLLAEAEGHLGDEPMAGEDMAALQSRLLRAQHAVLKAQIAAIRRTSTAVPTTGHAVTITGDPARINAWFAEEVRRGRWTPD